MRNKLEATPFIDSPEKRQALLDAIESYKSTPGALVQVLQKAQEIYGYLPLEVQMIVSENYDVPLAEVYGVVSFYSFFTIYPKGENTISLCLGTACYVRGAGEILKRLMDRLGIASGGCTADGKFSLDACRCVGACGLAPIMMVNSDVYGRLNPKDVDEILAKYA